MKAINIKWDVDYDAKGNLLPTEVEIPKRYANDPGLLANRDLLEEVIVDWLSDIYDMTHEGFVIKE